MFYCMNTHTHNLRGTVNVCVSPAAESKVTYQSEFLFSFVTGCQSLHFLSLSGKRKDREAEREGDWNYTILPPSLLMIRRYKSFPSLFFPLNMLFLCCSTFYSILLLMKTTKLTECLIFVYNLSLTHTCIPEPTMGSGKE